MKTEAGQSKSETMYERIRGVPISRPSRKETTLCPVCRYAVMDLWNYCSHCGTHLVPVKKEIINDHNNKDQS